jgi:hypothetical protein
VGRSESFRASVQTVVRDAATRGHSVNELTATLREMHGHAYRRADMLADLRRHRAEFALSDARAVVGAAVSDASAIVGDAVSAANDAVNAAIAVGAAVPRYLGLGPRIARAGVAAFAIALLAPTIVFGATRADPVLVADTSETRAVTAARSDLSLPNTIAGEGRRPPAPPPTLEPTPAPTPEPTPVPTPTPVRLVAGGPGAVVIASWYGPGFFENRLPCWRWLQANNLPIQFLPDTWGVAHKTLPCGTMLVLTYGRNTITVPVVDRGPYIAGRELDLSPRVKAALGCTDLCPVLMQLK